jgi:hypothetical protein
MIRILKGAAPQELITQGAVRTAADRASFDAHTEDFLRGSFALAKLYSLPVVRETLRTRQYNKCCYSEAKFVGDYNHVEHFRPKHGVELEDGTWLFPCYYWLAYDWSNLYLSKERINVSYKKNYFPLVDEVNRNRTHNDHNPEEPILIDPGTEDPRNHIIFHKDEPIGLTIRGHRSIELLGLRHADFAEARRTKIAILAAFKDAVDQAIALGTSTDDPLLAGLIAVLRAAIQPDAEFSSMAIDFLSGWPPLA